MEPDSIHAAKALAQFLRTMISSNSKYDKVIRGEASFTPDENAGFASFNSFTGGDCFHCHGGVMGTDFSYKNNGLDEFPTDSGRGSITGISSDNFKFKVPSIRNIEYSSPYMHDGRFNTLDEVINFYSINVHGNSPNIDPLMEFSSAPITLFAKDEFLKYRIVSKTIDFDIVAPTPCCCLSVEIM